MIPAYAPGTPHTPLGDAGCAWRVCWGLSPRASLPLAPPRPALAHYTLCLPQGPSGAPLRAGSLYTHASQSGTPKSAVSALPGNWARTARLRCHPKASISEPREVGPASASEQASQVAVPAEVRAHIGQGCIPAAPAIALHPLIPLQTPCWWLPAAERRPAHPLSFPGSRSTCGEIVPSLTHPLQAVPRIILGSHACARPLAAFSPGSCSGQARQWGCSPRPFLKGRASAGGVKTQKHYMSLLQEGKGVCARVKHDVCVCVA